MSARPRTLTPILAFYRRRHGATPLPLPLGQRVSPAATWWWSASADKRSARVSPPGYATKASRPRPSKEGSRHGEPPAAPLVTTSRLPPRAAASHTVWVTRARPKVDRIACPWLIRRFVDASAVFLFVAASEVTAVAERFVATPFDIDDVFWSHRGGRCTFDTMIEEFGLKSDALDRLATIVRAADTGRLDLVPQAAGFLAASLGLSRMYRDDLAQLEAGMPLYDAFYRWCRDASEERHNWPAGHRPA